MLYLRDRERILGGTCAVTSMFPVSKKIPAPPASRNRRVPTHHDISSKWPVSPGGGKIDRREKEGAPAGERQHPLASREADDQANQSGKTAERRNTEQKLLFKRPKVSTSQHDIPQVRRVRAEEATVDLRLAPASSRLLSSTRKDVRSDGYTALKTKGETLGIGS